ncbi:hypothetical protein FRB95_013874 [Tulasnella sp. JGI-2019a]|nr:hypothetical protein FRB95_013874 [Tulasnella sp. JGI-2019a]
MVFVNAWGILHDEGYFSNPLAFNPDCFLGLNQPGSADSSRGATVADTTPSIDP